MSLLTASPARTARLLAILGVCCAGCGTAHLDSEPELRRFTFAMEAELPASGSGLATIWLPVPVADDSQELGTVRPTATGGTPREAYDAIGNRFLSLTGQAPLRLGYSVDVRRLRLVPPSKPAASGMASAHDAWLTPAKLAPLEAVRREALLHTAHLPGSWGKARALFDFVVDSIDEQAMPGGGQGRGDLSWAWRVRAGDASDIASVLVAMCQSVGVPASFETGYLLPPDDGNDWQPLTGAHCWARVFVSGLGWLPVDATLARRERARGATDFWFGGLDANRLRLARGRDLVLAPPQRGAPRNFVDGPYAESGDGSEITDLTVRIRWRGPAPGP
jgi:transglutaminase-like putative cysteine protease